ncbi:acyl-CoA thioesterase [Akkermansia muciniphila]|jgi:YbgC/YbaW family acyl-CoA thioester hydrolase|uniref:acyl-CoA thioesterase n=1 Tax=Akkermansia muciniphila TaxID=239935 RepID=UPI000FE16EE4|nr:thioesterase family protein [Akkermansia muciniphila]QAA35993.1 acyl-CoA thioesterase [Akkermansia muciniphila]
MAGMNPELMFHTEDEVMFYDTDCGGVVHNLAYLRMIEACRTKLGAKLGMDYKTMSDLQQFAVVVRHEIDYVRPAVLGDTILTTGWLQSVDRARFWCDFEMRRVSNNDLLVRAHQQLALVQMPQGRPARIPAEWRARWLECMES